MTPVEAFDKLGFSPIVQAIGGLLWFSLVLGLMMRAEFAKKKANGGPVPAPPAAAAAVAAMPDLDKLIELTQLGNELQRQTCLKIGQLQQTLNAIGENLKLIHGLRDRQIDEIIAAIKGSEGSRGWRR